MIRKRNWLSLSVPEGMSRSPYKRLQDPSHWLLLQVRGRAKQKGLECNLSREDLVIPDKCPVLGIPLSWGLGRMNVPSVDRIDNRKGYVKRNVAVVSWRANWLKADATVEELRLLVNYYGKETREPPSKKDTKSSKSPVA